MAEGEWKEKGCKKKGNHGCEGKDCQRPSSVSGGMLTRLEENRADKGREQLREILGNKDNEVKIKGIC